MPGDWLSLSEIATELGVHPSTVRNWADQGDLPVH
jgi:excisionase family DNA binding protein